jgi:dUTP pyrophosphatase
MTLKVKKMKENATLPTKGSEKAAAVDLYACIDEPIAILPNQSCVFGTGIACDIPEGYFGAIVVRSSVGIKRQLMLMNSLGVIDEDYKGEIMMGLYNYGKEAQVIEPNERVAQMMLLPYAIHNIMEVEELSDSERGTGGIGSTGKF